MNLSRWAIFRLAMASSSSFLILHLLLPLLLLLSTSASASLTQQQNITVILNGLNGYSLFNRLLSSTGVAGEINSRSSLTILAPNDSILGALLDGYIGGGIPEQQMSDILRYHVLLEYLEISQMRLRPPGDFVTTLYQTTGRAVGSLGWVGLCVEQNGAVGIGLPILGAAPNATILTSLKLFPYNISVLQIDKVLIPPQLTKSPPPPSINITDALVRDGRFNTFVAFLQATGVDQIFQESESKEGITIFAPADDAFAALPSASLQKLTAQQKILVLEYHALNAFYPLGTLKDFKNPVAPTIATTDPRSGGAGQFTVNVTSVNGVFTIYTGIDSAPVTATIMEDKPVAIFVIDRVLLPKNIFGTSSGVTSPSPPSFPERPAPRSRHPPPPPPSPPPFASPTSAPPASPEIATIPPPGAGPPNDSPAIPTSPPAASPHTAASSAPATVIIGISNLVLLQAFSLFLRYQSLF